MKMYKVKQQGSQYSVVETRTEQVVGKTASYKQARELARSLACGGAFNGFTPAFFVANTAPGNIWPIVDF